TRATPKYRHHRPSGQAAVVLQNKMHYLGPYGSQKSRAAYDRLIAEWLAKGRAPNSQPEPTQITVGELILAYWGFARQHYVKNNAPTAEQDCIHSAIRHLRRLYGNMPAIKFGPLALKAVRQKMIDAKLSRGTINKHIGRIRRMFRWATAEEKI